MNLLIDSGNSRVKWATYPGAGEEAGFSVGDAIDRARPDFAARLAELVSKASSDAAIFISDVAVNSDVSLVDQVKKLNPEIPVIAVLSADAGYGVSNCYKDAETLGSDRWAALIGARESHSGDLIILDCGTAITVDAMNDSGRFIGGMILPSAWLAEQALSDGTSLIDRQTWRSDDDPRSLGQSTGTCVQLGASAAAMGGVKMAVEIAAGELSDSYSVIVTGGDALLYIGALGGATIHDPALVLRGLAVIADAQNIDANAQGSAL